jgi:hypothetical protein
VCIVITASCIVASIIIKTCLPHMFDTYIKILGVSSVAISAISVVVCKNLSPNINNYLNAKYNVYKIRNWDEIVYAIDSSSTVNTIFLISYLVMYVSLGVLFGCFVSALALGGPLTHNRI